MQSFLCFRYLWTSISLHIIGPSLQIYDSAAMYSSSLRTRLVRFVYSKKYQNYTNRYKSSKRISIPVLIPDLKVESVCLVNASNSSDFYETFNIVLKVYYIESHSNVLTAART